MHRALMTAGLIFAVSAPLMAMGDAVAALDIKLSDAQIASLEAPYAPRAVQGHS